MELFIKDEEKKLEPSKTLLSVRIGDTKRQSLLKTDGQI